MLATSLTLLNIVDLADLFHVRPATIDNWLKDRSEFPRPVKVGQRRLWRRDDVAKFIEALPNED